MMNDFDKKVKQMAYNQPVIVPDGFESRIDRLVDDIIFNNRKEKEIMKIVNKKRISAIFVAVAVMLLTSITAFAAWHILTAQQFVEYTGNQKLTEAFKSKDAIEINKSAISNGFKFTLLGIVSGEGISDFGGSAAERIPNRTYAVVSVEKADGSKMPGYNDAEQPDFYSDNQFLVSLFVRGQKPWQVNIFTMGGSASSEIVDGVFYRIVECDGVEMFADRGIYLAVCSGVGSEVFAFNEETGEISPKEGCDGLNVLFDLPLDKTKADPIKAEQYLKELLEPFNKPSDEGTRKMVADIWDNDEVWGKAIVDPDSIKVVSPDKDGFVYYKYELKSGAGGNVGFALDYLFEEGQTGVAKSRSVSDDSDGAYAVQLSRDENGTITGMIVRWDLSLDELTAWAESLSH